VLEWDPIHLATADLVSLALFRNGQKAGNIPRPLAMHSTKISGLAVDTEYTFHLVLRTTAGTYTSEKVTVRTHKMTDLSGVTITTGILPGQTREALGKAVERIGAKIVEGVRIDTTHFVTTEGRGVQWEKAMEMNIPVVRPEWVEACEKNGRILGVTKFYLDAVRQPAVEERPAAAAVQAQKELPERPKEERSEAEKKEEGGQGEESDESEAEEHESEKVRSGGLEEQKVRGEERDEQNLAGRPKQVSVADEESDEDDDDDETEKPPSDETEEPPSSGKGAKSPGEGGSFQDVAL
jgi:hypothetical protein